jgi:hypothetical protein
LSQARQGSASSEFGRDLVVEAGRERVSCFTWTGPLEVELIVQTVVRVPPFLTFDRESDTDQELTFVELAPEVFELDAKAESIPSLVASGG